MNRVSNTRSASSGMPNLNPKLMSWIVIVSGWQVARAREQPLPELAQRQVRRVDDDVGLRADRVEEAPLELDRGLGAAAARERVAVARLREAPDEDLVAGLEEEDLRPDAAALERPAHRP